MQEFDKEDLKKIFIPNPSSHKGQNGKLMVIGGSSLFHAASLWSLKIASRIVDMVFYSSVPQNNEIVQKQKQEFNDGIIITRDKIESYILEADCILIGPGLPREDGEEEEDDNTKLLTEDLLRKYPFKKWVIDGGSLQTIDPKNIPQNAILTPHSREFEKLFSVKLELMETDKISKKVEELAKKYKCTILLKGEVDIVSNGEKTVLIKGGNAGMTKGGTGDVLAGLITSLYCKNDSFLSACVGSYINKRAGDSLFEKVGFYFNASDLVDEIPKVINLLTKNN
ncbi:MAG TPA: NAD(P)H-hydrate dehydratase [Patescibacteria group bacterium]|nr:NAD(P)H-hydrate dehydratase [Patescibacteria group bacterium]